MSEQDDTRFPLTCLDIAAERKQALRELFPEAFTEAGIDFDKLRRALGDDVDTGPERYGLSWAGKFDAVRAVQTLSSGTLLPCKEESVNWDTTENLIIEGDNLEVLKLLQRSYYGKVKMIYIDPPYNTGNEFIYPDNFREGLDTYLRYTGQLDENGSRLSTDMEAAGRFHSRWLTMMYPRLFLARNLLREDGYVCVSISDNEVCSLRFLLNEVFGEENFVGQFVWKSRQFPDARALTHVSTDHEYIVVYSRQNGDGFRGIERDETKFSNPDADPRGEWMSRSLLGLATAEQRPNLHYDIVDPATAVHYPPPADTGWRYSRETMENLIKEGRILFPGKPSGRPREKKFRSDLQSEFSSFPSIISEVYTSHGTNDIRTLFGYDAFDFPKPVSLIKRFVQQTADQDDILLDFFAGSGTTGEAVLSLNKDDGGNRKFILVQLPEPTGRDDYPTIADICKERVRRVIKKLNDEGNGKLNMEDNPQDRGFKVLKLSSSNFKLWNADTAPRDAEGLAEQLRLYADHLIPGRSQDDILYELLLKAGLSLSAPIEEKMIAGQKVFSVNNGALMICLEDPVNPETLRRVIDLKPETVLCLDHAFRGNDELKTNIVIEMKSHEIKFQTV